MNPTKIAYVTHSLNLITGCTPVSEGCLYCWAKGMCLGRLKSRILARPPVVDTPENTANPFAVRLWPERLAELEVRPRKPRRIFICDLADIYHPDVPEEYLRRIFEVLVRTDHHTYVLLTKRPENMLRFHERNKDLFPVGTVPGHIWMGVTIENQRWAHRADLLRQLPAAVRFISAEPLLGPLALNLEGISWLICGGESGPKNRPMDMDWARSLRDQCQATGTAYFFKQIGGRTPKAGGALLDGREWKEYPKNHLLAA